MRGPSAAHHWTAAVNADGHWAYAIARHPGEVRTKNSAAASISSTT